MSTLDERLANAQKRNTISKLNAETRQAQARVSLIKKVNKIVASYDTLDPANAPKRKKTKTQKKSNDERIKPKSRVKGATQGRSLEENTATFKSLMQQFRVSVVGAPGPKLQVNTKDDFAEEATTFFNGPWSKWCDSTDDTPLAEQVANALIAVKREGDILCVFDDFLRDDGRLIWFESTQILEIDSGKWAAIAKKRGFGKTVKRKFVPYTQKAGYVIDTFGRVVAYIVTPLHGKTTIDPDTDKYSIVMRYDPIDNPEGSAKLIKAPWRFNQHRGEAVALTINNQQQDIYEMLAAELQTAKKASQTVGWLSIDKDSDNALVGAARILADSGQYTTEQIDALINGAGEDPGAVNVQYDILDGLTGGKFTYPNPGEKPEFLDSKRPNMSVTGFCDWVQTASGAAYGLGRARSTLKAETSYTAFRGEELMSWQTFEWDQKFLERRLMDFLAFKVITWAIRKTIIKTKPKNENWHWGISWAWPKMREVNELVTQQAIQLKLKNGTANFAEILGPGWLKLFEALGEQLEAARDNDLPLSIFETVSGTVIEDVETEPKVPGEETPPEEGKTKPDESGTNNEDE